MTTMQDTPIIHEVGIAIDGQPAFVLDVPTFYGREAAERRARFVIAARYPSMDLDRITVCSPEADAIEDCGGCDNGECCGACDCCEEQ